MSAVVTFRSQLESLLQKCQKYTAAVESCTHSVNELKNLGEQLTATRSISSSHVVVIENPDVIERMESCLYNSISECVTALQSHMQKVKSLRDKILSIYSKSKDILEIKDLCVTELVLRTETLPSVADVLMWTEALHTMVNMDCESRHVLASALTCDNCHNMVDLSNEWKSCDDIKEYIEEVRAYSQFFLEV